MVIPPYEKEVGMNRKTALFLLTAGGIAGVSLFAVVNMFIIPLFLIEIFFIFFGADRLRILFRERYGTGTVDGRNILQ